MGGVDVNVIHGRGDPGMTQGLLDRDQVHPAQVKLGGAEMPQHVRGDPLRPVRQVRRRRGGQGGPQRLVADPRRAPVGVAALGAEQRGTGPGVIIIEAGPDVLDEPAQGRPGAVDQRHHPLPRPGPAGALAHAGRAASRTGPGPTSRRPDQDG